MLVRLLGKEEEAGRLAYDAPFTDPVSYTHLDVYKRQTMDMIA